MSRNDLTLVREIVHRLRCGGHEVWLFGGWAEELAGVRPIGPHADIDLLLRAADFEALDAFLTEHPYLSEIAQKRFSHKRAFVFRGVRVEILLVQPVPSDRTVMFDGRVVIDWPEDTFAGMVREGLSIVSSGALSLYRSEHSRVAEAYTAYRLTRTPAG